MVENFEYSNSNRKLLKEKLRVTQLFNKTNQLNLTTRRLAILKLVKLQSDITVIFLFSMQLTNLGTRYLWNTWTRIQNKTCLISDFILSCRAMGRGVEETMLSVAFDQAIERKLKQVKAVYLPTDKNRPTLDVFQKINS